MKENVTETAETVVDVVVKSNLFTPKRLVVAAAVVAAGVGVTLYLRKRNKDLLEEFDENNPPLVQPKKK